MFSNFTQENLISFIYGEAPQDLSDRILSAKKFDSELIEKLDDLGQIKRGLNKLKYNPSALVVENILLYSKNSLALEIA